MKADLRRQIAERIAELAVDRLQALCDEQSPPRYVAPEDLLDIQHDLEDVLYRELASVRV